MASSWCYFMGFDNLDAIVELTQKKLKEQVSYDPITGVFRRLVSNSSQIKIGDILCGTSSRGYGSGCIFGKRYQTHRLAWLYMTGSWPKECIDHINHKKNDNRWCNLRECTRSQNGANRPKTLINTSGFKGVFWHKKNTKWMAKIVFKGEIFYLGTFTDKNDAVIAYNKKAEELFGSFAYPG